MEFVELGRVVGAGPELSGEALSFLVSPSIIGVGLRGCISASGTTQLPAAHPLKALSNNRLVSQFVDPLEVFRDMLVSLTPALQGLLIVLPLIRHGLVQAADPVGRDDHAGDDKPADHERRQHHQ